MAKKNTPVWQMLGIPEPEVELGYWSYGTVFTPGQEPGRLEVWRDEIRWGLWSYKHWGKKVKRDVRVALKAWWRVRLLTLKGGTRTLD